jgi:hypothetical protein
MIQRNHKQRIAKYSVLLLYLPGIHGTLEGHDATVHQFDNKAWRNVIFKA